MVYAIIAENAVGVMSTWDKAQHELLYLKGLRYPKKFHTYREANEFALAKLAAIAPGKRLPVDLSMNYVVKVDMLDPLIVPFNIRME